MQSIFVRSSQRVPDSGLVWEPIGKEFEIPIKGGPGWASRCPSGRVHASAGLPRAMELEIPKYDAPLLRVHLAGIFAISTGCEQDAVSSAGACVVLSNGGVPCFTFELVSGRHYTDSTEIVQDCRYNGDGSSLEMIDGIQIGSMLCRVDLLAIDIPAGLTADKFQFIASSVNSAFIIFDVLFEFGSKGVCPFRSQAGSSVSLSELGAIVRLGDKIRLTKAIQQLDSSLRNLENDLDDARGQALTFLAVISAALLELGAPRKLHRFQLDAARVLDRQESLDDIANQTGKLVQELLAPNLESASSTGDILVDKALCMVERYYGKDLTDTFVAEQLGLSTSHFRYLFKRAMNMPFHQYLIATRLEKSRYFLTQSEMSLTEILSACGFASSSHFTRAFRKRFKLSPSALRQKIRKKEI